MAPTKILVVDDEASVRYFVEQALCYNGHEVITVASGQDALDAIQHEDFDAAVIDLKMGGIEGLDVLAALREHTPGAAAVVLTGHGSLDTAIEALRRGADDYLLKPCDLKQLRQSIQSALQKQRAARRQRATRHLVSGISQELRDPLASIEVNVQLLERGQPEQRARYLENLKRAMAQVERLVENTTAISQLEEREPSAALPPTDLNALVAQTVDVHRARIRESGGRLAFAPEPNLPRLHLAHDAIARVIDILLRNALHRAGRAGEVRVNTWLTARRVGLAVVDNGPAIAPEALPHLFEPFYRERRAGDGAKDGLDLAMVKEIVEQHDGWVEVESDADQGTVFRVWLTRR